MPFDPTVGTWDFGFLPPNFNGDVQVFFTDNAGQGSQKWVKPRAVTMCYLFCIAGGGGGGAGRGGASTTARGGGAGGACSGTARMLVPAIFLPDVLSIQVGNGGIGGAGGAGAGGASGAGTNSYISYGVGISAISIIPNVILQSGVNAPGGGAAGGTSGNATGGSVPTITTLGTLGGSAYNGIPAFSVGLVGSTGGIATGGAGTITTSWLGTASLGQGAGGGGVNSVGTGFAGGAIDIQAPFDLPDLMLRATNMPAGGAAGGAGAAGNGNAGVQLWKPFYMTGGSGGGSSDGSTGGNGGNGGIGCGGGGGGGGTTGGTGGNGGDGCVIIISW